jgi:hypothetical protein
MLCTKIVNIIIQLIEVVIEKLLCFLTFNIFYKVFLERSLEIKAFSQKIFCLYEGNTFSNEMIGLFVQKIIELLKKISCKT